MTFVAIRTFSGNGKLAFVIIGMTIDTTVVFNGIGVFRFVALFAFYGLMLPQQRESGF